MTKTTRMELVESCYKLAMKLLREDLNTLPEGAVNITSMVLGLVDRMMPPDFSNLTAAGVETVTHSESEQ